MAESNLAFCPKPSTSFSGTMRLQSSSVRDLSVRGSWIMMPLIELSLFARMISSRSALLAPVTVGLSRSSLPCQSLELFEEVFVQISITSIPISSPYCFLRLTYFSMTGLSESRRMRSLGFVGMLAT